MKNLPPWLKGLFSFPLLAPRCIIDKAKMVKLGETSDGFPVYQCTLNTSHTYSPGVDIGDKDELIARTKGTFRGEGDQGI